MPVLLLELMIPPTTGWVAQWQNVPHVWGSPGFDPRSGLFFLFLQLLVISHWTRLHPLASGDALALFIHPFHGLGMMCSDSSNSSNIVVSREPLDFSASAFSPSPCSGVCTTFGFASSASQFLHQSHDFTTTVLGDYRQHIRRLIIHVHSPQGSWPFASSWQTADTHGTRSS